MQFKRHCSLQVQRHHSSSLFAGSFNCRIAIVSAERGRRRGSSVPTVTVAECHRRHVVGWASTARALLSGSGGEPVSATCVIPLFHRPESWWQVMIADSVYDSMRFYYADFKPWTSTSRWCRHQAAATLLHGCHSQCPMLHQISRSACNGLCIDSTNSAAAFACLFCFFHCLPWWKWRNYMYILLPYLLLLRAQLL